MLLLYIAFILRVRRLKEKKTKKKKKNKKKQQQRFTVSHTHALILLMEIYPALLLF